jgi:carboxyl-terminal processing protease
MGKNLKPLLIWGLTLVFMPLHAQLFNEQSMKFSQALEYVKSLYVDTINDKQLTETAIISMMKELDPHSSYMTAKEVKEMNEPLMGNFEGIGVQFNILNDTIFIIQTIAGGPSEKLGINAGDKIIKIDGKNVAGIKITNKDVFSKLRGQKGSKVKISILRRGEKELIDFTITRDKIPIFSIDATYMIDDETGYIKLNRFSQTTGREFEKAMHTLQAKNVKNLILDLTDNGGGYLDEAWKLADQFLDNNKLIVYTQGVHARREEYRSTAKGLFEKGKLIILIDEGSASASEILSGAIQDWDRGYIVGRRSFGKGLVQRPLMFPDSSMLKLTVARYYTPSGRLIQKPYNKGTDEYEKDILNRYNKGEFSNKDSIHFKDSLKCYTLVDKRVVYGGGGIMPDFFVPIDTTDYTNYYRDIVRKGIVNKFVLNYIDQNRVFIKTKYPDITVYDKTFNTDTVVTQMLVYAEKEGLKPNIDQIKISKPSLTKLVKAYIARDIWDSNEFYEIYNKDEPMLKKALDVIHNWDSRKKELLKTK